MPIDLSSSGDASFGTGPMLRWLSPPLVSFGSPVQRSKDETQSFWHVPISLKRLFGIDHPIRVRLGSGQLPNCRAYCDIYDGDRIRESIRLMWGDAVFSKAGETATLLVGETLLVPVAWRREGDANAYICDTRYLLKDEKHHPIAGDRKKLRFKLRVQSRSWANRSQHFYNIRVPTVSSNGHFVCEIEYDGEGTRSSRAAAKR